MIAALALAALMAIGQPEVVVADPPGSVYTGPSTYTGFWYSESQNDFRDCVLARTGGHYHRKGGAYRLSRGDATAATYVMKNELINDYGYSRAVYIMQTQWTNPVRVWTIEAQDRAFYALLNSRFRFHGDRFVKREYAGMKIWDWTACGE